MSGLGEGRTVHAEIVVTGTELLLGEIVDTNSTMISRMLRDIGLDLYYKSTVGDNRERMASVLNIALDRSDIVLVSGGLGPTVDDVTRDAVAGVTGRPLVFQPDLLEQIAARFARFGRPMTDNNRRQAYVPEGAIVIQNPVGTAPGFIVEDARSPQDSARGRGIIICLPGVPRELEYLMKQRVIPYLKERIGEAAVIKAKVLCTCVVGESQIDALIGDLMTGRNPTVGLAAHPGQVDVRITAKGASEVEVDRLIAAAEAELRARLGSAIYGEGTETLEEVVGRLLANRGMTLALVDSITGGEVADRLRAGLPGERPLSQVLVWEDRPQDAFAAALAVGFDTGRVTSEPQKVAEHIATWTRQDTGAGLGLAIFGMVPKAEDERPLAFLSLSDGTQKITRSFLFGNEDKLARRWLSTRALDLIRRHLVGALGQEMG